MKKKISILLAVALLVSLVPAVYSLGTAAEDSTGSTTGSGLVLNKTATYDEKTGKYWVELEAYATGSSTQTDDSKVPVDFVLVLDQSGSMSENMSKDGYGKITGNSLMNSSLYRVRMNNNGQNGNLYYKDGNTYYQVSVERTQVYTYTALDTSLTNTEYYSKRNNLYADANGSTKVDVSWDFEGWNIKYTYKIGNSIIGTSYDVDGVPDFGNYSPLYERSSQNRYTYSYVKNGQTIQLGTSDGDSTQFTEKELYSKGSSTTERRLDALIAAADTFADEIYKKATTDKVNHRVAIVGFSSTNYQNTEVLTGVTVTKGNYYQNKTGSDRNGSTYYFPDNYAHNGVQYNSRDINTAYKNALQSMDTTDGYNNVKSAIDYLTAYGGTETDKGLEMAKGIFNANEPVAGQERKRVVILLTDGIPTGSGSAYDSSTYNKAKKHADDLKGNSYNATIYTIGIFDGANPGNEVPTSVSQWDDKDTIGNYVCQNLSSNNGKVQNPSYYLSAGTAEALRQIFKNLAGEADIVTTPSTELGASAVIQDIIAPQFQLPANTTVTLESYAYGGTGVWTKNETALGAQVIVSGDKVDVTGFDFKENWCGKSINIDGEEEWHGNKLVIKFPVEVKDGFLGGNDVYTNTEAKVYANPSDAMNGKNAVDTFPKPTVNVPIKEVKVTPTDKNVYLLGGLTGDQIKSGTTVICGTQTIDLSKAGKNYGLESWQTEYVNITVIYKDEKGNDVIGLENLEGDTKYTVTVTVAPKETNPKSNQGETATEKSGTGEGNIYVFKPELTFKDSEVYYGDTAPDGYTNNYESTETVWKHGDSKSTDTGVTMTGDKPNLDLTYTPKAGTIVDDKIAVKTDIPVNVTVKINSTDVTKQTSFQHECNLKEDCGAPDDGKFWFHVKTCTLTIEKKAATGTTIGNDEYFVFTVKKDGSDYTQVTIKGATSVTIQELPVGTYTIQEDTSVAWRYGDPTYSGSGALSSTNPEGTLTCTNTKEKDNWLNDFTRAINTYGSQTPVTDGK